MYIYFASSFQSAATFTDGFYILVLGDGMENGYESALDRSSGVILFDLCTMFLRAQTASIQVQNRPLIVKEVRVNGSLSSWPFGVLRALTWHQSCTGNLEDEAHSLLRGFRLVVRYRAGGDNIAWQ